MLNVYLVVCVEKCNNLTVLCVEKCKAMKTLLLFTLFIANFAYT